MRFTLLPLAFASLAAICLGGAVISPKAESLDLPQRRSGNRGDYCDYNNDCALKKCDRTQHVCWVCSIHAVGRAQAYFPK